MIAEVYDAFRSADDAQARAAATSLAEHDRRYDELRHDIRTGDNGLREEIRRVETELREEIRRVETGLRERIERLVRRMSVLEWNVRLNSVLLLGLLKLIVFE